MPVGDYTNCSKCGKSIFGYGLCIECANSAYNFGESYDFYGNLKNTYASSVLPSNSNDGVTTLTTILNNQLKKDAKKHVQLLASMMGEPAVSDEEFEEFWSKYTESLSIMNKKETLNDIYHEIIEPKQINPVVISNPAKSNPTKEESLDSLYYEMIDNFENGGEKVRCDCECDCDCDITSDDIDKIIDELEFEIKNNPNPLTSTKQSDESLEDTFDNFFKESPVQKKENKPLKRKTLVVNLYAGPGSGKSTTAAGVFFELKSRGINCELATEFVKDLVWEERHKAISNQVYIFAKQQHRIARLLGEVDVIVTDSPLLLTLVYGKPEDAALKNLALVEHNKLWTFNCFIKRNKEYNPKGRWQTYAEARDLDRSIADMLDRNKVPYEVYFGNADGKDRIVNKILQILGER